METVMTDRDIQQPIPRRSDGKIKVTEYREIMWYATRNNSQRLSEIDKHLERLNGDVAKNTHFRVKFNFLGKVGSAVAGLIGLLIGIWRLVK